MHKFLLFLTSLLLFSCQNSPAPTPKEKNPIGDPWEVMVAELKLQDKPGLEGTEIARLKKGETVYFKEVKTDFKTKLKLEGDEYEEYWYEVEYDEKKGWVFGGGVLSKKDLENYSAIQERKSLIKIYGSETAKNIISFRNNYERASSALELGEAYLQAVIFRDSLEFYSRETGSGIFDGENELPGFLRQKSETGYRYFFNYKKWHARAAETKGDEDDTFFELYLKLYDVDSIEYDFPGWWLVEENGRKHHLLGSGMHLGLLESIDKQWGKNDLFKKELNDLKEFVLIDLMTSHETYWEDGPKIMAELQAIARGKFSFFYPEDLVGIQTKMAHFKNWKKQGLRINLRNGE